MGRWGRLIVTGIAIVTLVVGAGAGLAAADEYGNAPVVTVRMTDNEFTPQTVVVDPGTIVRWVNAGRNKHNIIVDRTSIEWSSSKTVKPGGEDRKSTRLNSSHMSISYAVFCLKKKKKKKKQQTKSTKN